MILIIFQFYESRAIPAFLIKTKGGFIENEQTCNKIK